MALSTVVAVALLGGRAAEPAAPDPALVARLSRCRSSRASRRLHSTLPLPASDHRTVAAGERVIAQGDAADRFYIAESGLYRVTQGSPGGDRFVRDLPAPTRLRRDRPAARLAAHRERHGARRRVACLSSTAPTSCAWSGPTPGSGRGSSTCIAGGPRGAGITGGVGQLTIGLSAAGSTRGVRCASRLPSNARRTAEAQLGGTTMGWNHARPGSRRFQDARGRRRRRRRRPRPRPRRAAREDDVEGHGTTRRASPAATRTTSKATATHQGARPGRRRGRRRRPRRHHQGARDGRRRGRRRRPRASPRASDPGRVAPTPRRVTLGSARAPARSMRPEFACAIGSASALASLRAARRSTSPPGSP